jgi:hypothetical protein
VSELEFRRNLVILASQHSEPSQFELDQEEPIHFELGKEGVPDTRRKERGTPFEKQLKKDPSEF